jgi:hypothetical protein
MRRAGPGDAHHGHADRFGKRSALLAALLACDEPPAPPPVRADAGLDAGVSDAAGDAGMCAADEHCDDGVLCNGLERCTGGACASETLVVEDGVACTTDRCDEPLGAILHVPDDLACAGLGARRACGTGTSAGSVVEGTGACDPIDGCVRAWAPIRDCTGAPSFTCDGAAIRRDQPACIAVTSSCGVASSIEEDCAGAIPSPHPFCDPSPAWHSNAAPVCRGEPPACGYTETVTPCVARPPACASGELTTFAAACADAAGCSETSTTSRCPDPPSTCAGPSPLVLTTYAPSCASPMGCGSPAATMTTCPGRLACVGRVLTTYVPTCDPIGEACGEAVGSQSNCALLDDCICAGVPPNAYQQLTTGLCTTTSGCDFATSPPVTCPNQCRCTPTPVCN